MSINRQLWQMQLGESSTMKSDKIPTTIPPGKLLVKVASWAINPCDALLQDTAIPLVTYPIILGQDIAGVVKAVAPDLTSRFAPGDRVFGLTSNHGFQEYVLLDHSFAAAVPPSLSFTDASIFGLCMTTSAWSLFGAAHLALPFPSLSALASITAASPALLIWGASSAVGCNAIQLARGAGLRVFATCSPRNFAYVQSLGADRVFDHASVSVVDDIVAEIDAGICVGIYLAAGSVADACQVAVRSRQTLRVSSTAPIMPGDCPEGVEAKMAYAEDISWLLEEFQTISAATFKGYMVEALQNGHYKVAPPPEVMGTKGLEGIQLALDRLKQGVSAKKLVVEAE